MDSCNLSWEFLWFTKGIWKMQSKDEQLCIDCSDISDNPSGNTRTQDFVALRFPRASL